MTMTIQLFPYIAMIPQMVATFFGVTEHANSEAMIKTSSNLFGEFTPLKTNGWIAKMMVWKR